MAEFYNNGTDVIVICASVFAFLIMLSRIIYKSKCKKNIFKIIRISERM